MSSHISHKKTSISVVCLIYIKKESEENMRAFIKAKSAEKDPNVCKKQSNNTKVTEKNQKVTVKAGSADGRVGPKRRTQKHEG